MNKKGLGRECMDKNEKAYKNLQRLWTASITRGASTARKKQSKEIPARFRTGKKIALPWGRWANRF